MRDSDEFAHFIFILLNDSNTVVSIELSLINELC